MLALVVAALVASPSAADVVHLRNGNRIEGEILVRRPERVVVDLGFTVVEVPVSEIERIVGGEREEKPARTVDLYRVEPGRDELTVAENVSRCGEAVVEVRTPTSLGSGFIVHPGGYVVTNDHVIAGEHELTVAVFARDGAELERVRFDDVRIVATSPALDLALLKIEELDGHELVALPIGDSHRLREGQTVLAIGSPLGFDRTVSEGIVSATDRVLAGRLFIQHTTEINPGNSGGPLLNLRGEVVGVNDLKLTDLAVEGMGFSIPAASLIEFLRNRSAWAFDPRNPNAGFRYLAPPTAAQTRARD